MSDEKEDRVSQIIATFRAFTENDSVDDAAMALGILSGMLIVGAEEVNKNGASISCKLAMHTMLTIERCAGYSTMIPSSTRH